MKPIVFIIMVFASLFSFVATASTQASETVKIQKVNQQKWDNLKNYVLYYGRVQQKELDILKNYDLVIIDTMSLGADAKEKIAYLKKHGCMVFGYFSYYEVNKRYSYFPQIKEEWFIIKDGKKWMPWGTNYSVSMTHSEWRKMLVELTKTKVLDYGCDGVFMDTIANIDNPNIPIELRDDELESLDKFLSEITKEYPQNYFVTNWTLKFTLPVVSKYVDAICWEDFSPEFLTGKSKRWMEKTAKRVLSYQAEHGFKVLALWNSDEEPEDLSSQQEIMHKFSKEYGFIPYCCIGNYEKLK